MSKEIQLNDSSNEKTVLGIDNFDKAWEIANKIADSEIVPPSLKSLDKNRTPDKNKTTANVFLVLHSGLKLGFDPLQSLQAIAIIQGRPVLWGDGLLALVQNHPEYVKHEETNNKDSATCVVYRRGHEPHSVTFTKDDAKKAGLLEKPGPWMKYTNRMLQMRARAFAIRDKFSDALKGLSVAEEMQDIAEEEKKYICKNPVNTLISRLNDTNDGNEKILNEVNPNPNPNADERKTPEQKYNIGQLLKLAGEGKIDKKLEKKWCDAAGVKYLIELTQEQASKCIEYLNERETNNSPIQ